MALAALYSPACRWPIVIRSQPPPTTPAQGDFPGANPAVPGAGSVPSKGASPWSRYVLKMLSLLNNGEAAPAWMLGRLWCDRHGGYEWPRQPGMEAIRRAVRTLERRGLRLGLTPAVIAAQPGKMTLGHAQPVPGRPHARLTAHETGRRWPAVMRRAGAMLAPLSGPAARAAAGTTGGRCFGDLARMGVATLLSGRGPRHARPRAGAGRSGDARAAARAGAPARGPPGPAWRLRRGHRRDHPAKRA